MLRRGAEGLAVRTLGDAQAGQVGGGRRAAGGRGGRGSQVRAGSQDSVMGVGVPQPGFEVDED